MKDAMEEYRAGLADFSQHGKRWAALEASPGKPSFVFWGKCAGLSVAAIVDDAHALGVRDRDGDIRRAWTSAHPNGGDRPRDWHGSTPRAQPKPPPTFPRFVRDMVEAGGEVDFDALKALSPVPIPPTPQFQTRDFLRLFADGGLLFIDDSGAHRRGVLGESIRSAAEWRAHCLLAGDMGGDLVCPNPLTGAEGETTDGRKSFVAQSCLARFPFAVVEFDSMPLKTQAAFWRGLLATSPLAGMVAALTFSGGKSIHGLLHVGTATLPNWQTARDKLRRLICADPDPTFRADEAALRPRTGARLPGVVRRGDAAKGGGNLQRLLYLNPDAAR